MISSLQYISDTSNGLSHEENIERACEAGVRWVQLRMKDISAEEYLKTALLAREITNRYNAVLVINDNPRVALYCKADGVHIGQGDMSIKAAKEIVGTKMMIGASTNSIEHVRDAARQGFDYAGIGPYRFTSTKKNLNPILGLEGLSSILQQVKLEKIKLPLVAIGGIQSEDVKSLMKTGIHGIAVSSAITGALNPAEIVGVFHKSLAPLSKI